MRSSRSNLNESFNCKIRLLDDSELSYDFKKESVGSCILDFVCNELDLHEKDYFGLRYVDNNKQRHWLVMSKDVIKQLKDSRQPYMFFFRVKFYPTDPTKLSHEVTRFQLYLQLKRDILHGRLLCPFNNITDLAAHIVQVEIGDYNPEEHGEHYVAGLNLLPRQNDKLVEKIMEYHATLEGYTPEESENRFLNLARTQDLYGVDPHPCQDHQENKPSYLGLTPNGIQVIREAKRVSGFSWSQINKVSYKNKVFYIQTASDKQKKSNFAFCLNDTPSAKHLWICTVEHMAFYGDGTNKALHGAKRLFSPNNFFNRNSFKRTSMKTESELIAEGQKRSNPSHFTRNHPSRASLHTTVAKTKQLSPFEEKNRLSMPNLDDLVATSDDAGDEISLESSESYHNNSSLAAFRTEQFPSDVGETESVCSAHEDAPDIIITPNGKDAKDSPARETPITAPPLVDNAPPVQAPPPVDNAPPVQVPPLVDNVPLVQVPPLVDNAPPIQVNAVQTVDSSTQAMKSAAHHEHSGPLQSFNSPTFVLLLAAIICIPLAIILNIIYSK